MILTPQSINVKRSTDQYQDLQPIYEETLPPENTERSAYGGLVTHKSRTLPRAKKSTSQSWLDSLECKPDIEGLYVGFWITHFYSRLSRLEVDTICLPFPQILDHPFVPGIGNPSLSISSFEVNFEDSERWTSYELPVTVDDV